MYDLGIPDEAKPLAIPPEGPLLPGLEEAYGPLDGTPASAAAPLPPPAETAAAEVPARPSCARAVAVASVALVLGVAIGFGLGRMTASDGRADPAAEGPAVPLALLPETAEADAWSVVSGMTGEIGGVPLVFRRGLATTEDGRTYRVALDFCRGAEADAYYAQVSEGDARWIVRADATGRIRKAYRRPPAAKSLRELFGR